MSDAPIAAERIYSRPARLLHWTIAALIIPLIVIGVVMTSIPWGETRNALYSGHKLVGFLALWLIAARIGWRLMRGAPAPHAGLTRAQRLVSGGVHGALYVLMAVVPILGWIGVSAYPAVTIFGAFDLPSIWPADRALSERVLAAHAALALAMGALILLHVGAALAHRLVFRDGVFQRMWPERG